MAATTSMHLLLLAFALITLTLIYRNFASIRRRTGIMLSLLYYIYSTVHSTISNMRGLPPSVVYGLHNSPHHNFAPYWGWISLQLLYLCYACAVMSSVVTALCTCSNFAPYWGWTRTSASWFLCKLLLCILMVNNHYANCCYDTAVIYT